LKTTTIETQPSFAYNEGMIRRAIIISLIVLSLVGSLAWQSSQAQGNERYFDETGHVVTGEFLEFYQRVPNPIQLYGYPITDAFQDPTRNILVQYFQKARFELDPAGVAGNRVKISPLGEYLYTPGPEASLVMNPGACRTFAPDGYRVCYSFLDFYDDNDGRRQFGDPISNAEVHNDRVVQYFQNARFEWHPELEKGQWVALAHLGSEYFARQAEDPTLLLPNQGGDIINSIRTLKVRAYPAQAVTGKAGSQTVYIMVQDQRLLPVANAQVTIILRLPDQKDVSWMIPAQTNNDGITQFTFPFSADEVGVATIRVIALRGDLESNTTTSFRLWW
jgi:hypothetical protein